MVLPHPFSRLPALAALVLVAIAVFTMQAAFAAAAAIDAKLSVVRIEFNGRAEVASAADRARPGDVLEYSTRFVNRGSAAAQSFTPTMPVPAGTEYVAGGTSLAPTHASLDGVTMQPIPLHRTVTGANGRPTSVEVPSTEYRALRWTVGVLDAGAEVTVRARVRIAPAAAIADATAGRGR